MCILQPIRKICNASLMYRTIMFSSTTTPWIVVACCWPPSCPQAWIHWTAAIGWLTFPCQGKEAIHYPFRASLHSLVPAGGLTHLSILLTENTPPEPVCSFELSNLTVLLFRRVPYHFRCGQYTWGRAIRNHRWGKPVYLHARALYFYCFPQTPNSFITNGNDRHICFQ